MTARKPTPDRSNMTPPRLSVPETPREAESLAVAQARAEGKIDVVLLSIKTLGEKVVAVQDEVFRHRGEISALQSATQKLESDMVGAEAARVLAATAVKDADAVRVAQAKELVDNSTQRWTPVTRFYASVGAIAAIVAVVYYLYLLSHTRTS